MAERVRVWALCIGFGLFLPFGIVAKQSMDVIFMLMAIATIIATAIAKPRDLIPATAPTIAFCALAIYIIATQSLMPECGDCLRLAAIKLPMLGLIVWVAASNAVRIAPEDAARVGWSLCAGLLVAGLIALIELNTNGVIHRAIKGNPDDVSIALIYNRGINMLILLVFPVAAWLWRCGWRVGALASIAFALTVTFSSFSLSAMVAGLLGIAAGIAALIAPAVTFWAMIAATAGFWAVAPWFLILFFDLTAPYFPMLSSSLFARIQIWERMADGTFNAPFFGHGIRAIRRLPPTPSEARHLGHGVPDYGAMTYIHPHNVAIQIWFELGAVGVVLFAALFMALLWPFAKTLRALPPPAAPISKSAAMAGMAAMAGIILTALVSFGLWQSTWLAMVAVTVLACRILALSPAHSTRPLTRPLNPPTQPALSWGPESAIMRRNDVA